jgi:curli production assembly/transport component CsgG
VTQGGGSILIKALQDAGQRKWFTVVEREQFKDLLNERQVIREMRERYLGEKDVNPNALPSLLFAGVLLEGGIISYDTNTHTGGAGAAMLGIGVNGQWRQDTVTVYLRAVSVKTGEVLTSVTTSKTITSYALTSNVFGYVASDKILENEIGYTTNEPNQLALQQAIEKAVYGLVLEGVDLKLWSFQDPQAGWPYLWRYREERDGLMNAGQVQAALEADRRKRGLSSKAKASETSQASAPGQARLNTRSDPRLEKAEGPRPTTVSSAEPARGPGPVLNPATPAQGSASSGGL